MNDNQHHVTIDLDLKELIPLFLENRHKDTLYLRQALNDHNHHAIARIGHNLKGTAGSYGFAGMAQLGQKLEQAAQQENPSKENQLIERLESLLTLTEVFYE
ncbi:MAG: Hpt domain-containing protein [Gammaproteobacteria bacterium]|nr:Hpt domain-containing protein [Gammaproteobacteria bacterium]